MLLLRAAGLRCTLLGPSCLLDASVPLWQLGAGVLEAVLLDHRLPRVAGRVAPVQARLSLRSQGRPPVCCTTVSAAR